MDTPQKSKVCVIGSGLRGILALGFLHDICDMTCYEMQDKPCGLWNYTDLTDETVDKSTDFYANMYGHNYGSMYENLVSVGPKNLQRFKDFNDKIEEDHFSIDQYRDYLLDYIEANNIGQYINYNTAVVDLRVNGSADENLHWKVTIQKGIGGEKEILYFDYVIVANGNHSVPLYNHTNVQNLNKFKGTVMHAHNFRTPNSDQFVNKHILFVGAKMSGCDILYKFLGNGDDSKVADFKSITISQGRFGFLQNTTNFRKYIENGKLIIKNAGLDFKENSVIFEDGTEQEIDTVLFWTGYKYSFPFLKDTDLIEIDDHKRWVGPMFKRYWCANDPTLMFLGLVDGPTSQAFIQKCLILARHYILGEIKMPDREEMLKDIQKFEEIAPKDATYLVAGQMEFTFQEDLYDFYKENLGDKALPYNTEFNEVMLKMVGELLEHMTNGNWHDFKHPDVSDYDLMDTFEYF